LKLIFSAFFSTLLGFLFLFAGRALEAAGAVRGRAVPWIIITILVTVPLYFVHAFVIPSQSMENALLPGDSIVVQVFPLHAPQRGELVVFKSPTDASESVVKRVVAVPGDHIRISRNVVILNGSALDEKYVSGKSGVDDFYPPDLPNDADLPGCSEGKEEFSQHIVNGEIVVPEGGYFVLGDNRENSLDSRCYGFVDKSELIGKPLMIYDSVDETPEQASSGSLVWSRHTRWARLFTFF
jgi:signal peptidase I